MLTSSKLRYKLERSQRPEAMNRHVTEAKFRRIPLFVDHLVTPNVFAGPKIRVVPAFNGLSIAPRPLLTVAEGVVCVVARWVVRSIEADAYS
jgi:hypothetical protein